MSFNVSVGEEVLDITLMLPGTSEYTTRGLLGVSDGDVNNDFTLPNGTVLDINSTEEEIYYGFGQQCKSVMCWRWSYICISDLHVVYK